MKLYCNATDKNLALLGKDLSSKYESMVFSGSNDLDLSITTVRDRHMIDEFDAFIILQSNFHEADSLAKKELSRKLNEACVYALKTLPIYFVYKSNNTPMANYIREHLTGESIHLYPYETLTVKVIEEIIKEVLVDKTDPSNIQQEVHRDMIILRENQKQKAVENQIDKALSFRRSRDSEDFLRLANIESMIKKFSSQSTAEKPMAAVGGTSLLSELQKNLFSPNEGIVTPVIGIHSFDQSLLKEKLNPEEIKKDLLLSNPDYIAMENYMTALKETINAVELSNEPDKHKKVLELMEEKALANNEMHKILTGFISSTVKSSVDYIIEQNNKDLETLKDFGDKMSISSSLERDAETVNGLRAKRETIISEMNILFEGYKFAVDVVMDSLKSAGIQYQLEMKKEEEEIKKYASSNSLSLANVTIPSRKEVVNLVNSSYIDVRNTVEHTIAAANAIFEKVSLLIETDNIIIDKQSNMLEIMSTQKVQKNVVVDNILQTKVESVIGPDGTGKTFFALNRAYSLRSKYKTLLVDLNLKSPSLRFYNNLEDPTADSSTFFNRATILMEEFLKIPVDRNIYSNIPFNNNISIIQPGMPMDIVTHSSYFSPNAFDTYVKNFLEQMALFFDKIILILPESLIGMEDILDSTGYLFVVNDFNITNIHKCSYLMRDFGYRMDKIPVRNFVFNKVHKNNDITWSDYLQIANFDSRVFTLYHIPEFPHVITDKLKGNISYDVNPTVRKTFEELLLRR